MIVFGVVVLAVALIASLDRRSQGAESPRSFTAWTLAAFIILGGVAALRWRVGTDYWTYEALFEEYADEVSNGISITAEPGLKVLAWIAMRATGDSAWMFALASLITVGLLLGSYWRWSQALTFTMALMVLTGVWQGTFNGVRQYLACAILVAGHRLLLSGERAKWCCVVFGAFLFHTSAAVGLLFLLVPKRRTSLKQQIILFGGAILAAYGSDALINLLAVVTDSPELPDGEYVNQDVSTPRVLFAFVPIGLHWLFGAVRRQSADSDRFFYVNLMAVYAAIYLVASDSAYLARFALYLVPFLPLALPVVTALPDRRQRFLLRCSVLVLYATFNIVEIESIPNLREFQWIFDRP